MTRSRSSSRRATFGVCRSTAKRAWRFASASSMPRVVGVAEDIVQDDLATSQRFHYYLPIDQFWPNAGSTLLMRVRDEPASHLESLRQALQRVMPGSSYITVTTMASLVDEARRSWK